MLSERIWIILEPANIYVTHVSCYFAVMHCTWSQFPRCACTYAHKHMLQVVFSGEEVFGKFFDLHSLYVRWVNMPQCTDKQLDYGAYLAGTHTIYIYTLTIIYVYIYIPGVRMHVSIMWPLYQLWSTFTSMPVLYYNILYTYFVFRKYIHILL
jgi:Pre-mRNA-splicing factor SF3A3, of SF3a complex, Prp9